MSKLTTGMFTSDKDYWETPKELFDELDKEFHFTLDPCATDSNHKCAKYYTEQQDGLSMPWGGGARFLQSTIRKRTSYVG